MEGIYVSRAVKVAPSRTTKARVPSKRARKRSFDNDSGGGGGHHTAPHDGSVFQVNKKSSRGVTARGEERSAVPRAFQP